MKLKLLMSACLVMGLTGCLDDPTVTMNIPGGGEYVAPGENHDSGSEYVTETLVEADQLNYTKLNYFSHFLSTSSTTTLFNEDDNFYTLDNLTLGDLDGNMYFLDTDDSLPLSRNAVGAIFELEIGETSGDVNDLLDYYYRYIATAINVELNSISTVYLPNTDSAYGQYSADFGRVVYLTDVINSILSLDDFMGIDLDETSLPPATNAELAADKYYIHITVKHIQDNRYVYIVTANPQFLFGDDLMINSVHDGSNTL